MQNTVIQYCRKEKLIEKGDCVLAGVSGGADSVSLLLLLWELRNVFDFSLQAVHVEHGIRGKESEDDAAFVEKLCENFKVPLKLYRVDALRAAKEQKMGVEEAARQLRYDCYKTAATELSDAGNGKIKIALAHHADDNAETVLFQMIRGSGIDGLCGMQPKRKLQNGLEVIRPMLCVTRAEVEQYLREKNQDYCTDSTNADENYSRNRIRGSVLPVLREVNAQAVSHINQSAAVLREVKDFLDQQVTLQAKQILVETKCGILVQENPFLTLFPVLKKEILYLALTRAAGAAKDIGSEHIRLLLELFSLQVGREISLPYQVTARRVYEGICLTKAKKQMEELPYFAEVTEKELLAAGGFDLEVPGGRLFFSFPDSKTAGVEIFKNTYTKYLDYGKMKNGFQIRTRQAGDYLVIDDAGHKKSLKEYFIQEKIPKEQRNQILLLASDHKILWVIGRRISADVKIDGQTEKVIKVQIKGENYYED